MKKIIIIILIALISSESQAQVFQKTIPTTKQNATLKTVPPPAPAPPTNTPPPAANVPYYLSAARVILLTGNDNKEQPSSVSIGLNRTSGGDWPSDDYTASCGLYQHNYATNEYKVNSVTDIALTTSFQFPGSMPGGVGEGWRYINLLLSNIQTHGLTLYVRYDPNFILDAWKIEKVTLVMEFKDIKGNPHPTLGSITIPFLNSSALLNDGKRILKLETDKFLMAKY